MAVSVNPPKTPVTKGSKGTATTTLPNVCKVPGPPAPFVPAALPNIGKSGNKPKGYSKSVKIEGYPVAIRGASFASVGDAAAQGTGGGLVSANTHGPCKFISPGSMNVKFEGRNVHLLGDAVTNNGGVHEMPANSATMAGMMQISAIARSPESDNTACPGPNGHQWIQIIPSGHIPLNDKINSLLTSSSPSFQFEGLAAQHNRDVSRDLTKSEHLSTDGEEIRMMCNVSRCVYNANPDGCPETDHLAVDPDAGLRSIVEVKSNPVFDERAARQMARNFQAIDQGIADALTMKYPAHRKYGSAIAHARAVAEILRKTVKIVRI